MKNIFRYLASVLFGAVTLVACQQEIAPLGTEISVAPATLSVAGQDAEDQTVNVESDGDWIAVAPEWITVTPSYGTGNTVVTLSFDDNLEEDGSLAAARKATVLFSVNETEAKLEVEQAGDPNKAPAEVKQVTCAEFNAAEDGAGPFRVIGTITNIEQISPSTAYNNGNLTISDETGDLYLYRVGPGDGKKLEDLGLAVGDKITVEGKKGSYNGNPQMAQGGVILEVEKSLISVNKVLPETLPIEGGELMVNLMCKGEGIEVLIPEDASWLTVVSAEQSGELAVVVLKAEANALGNRSTDVEFVTSFNGTEYKSVITVNQLGAIKDVTAAEINAAEDGESLYRLTGYITSIVKEEYGNLYIKDATGEVYVYGTLDAEGKSQNFASLGIKAGDIVTVVGPKTSYNGSPQMKNVTVENHIKVEEKTIAEFNEAKVDGEVYYRLTGTVSGMDNAGAYGNVTITDESGSVYVYGVLAGWGGEKGKFADLVKATGLAEGDLLTIVGVRADFKGTAQVGNAFYVSHEEGAAPAPEYSLDGKQWIAEMDGMQVLFDFGLTEEGLLAIALPTMDGTGFALFMAGIYEIQKTDAVSGVVSGVWYDWEYEETYGEIEIPYSELGEASVKLVCETVFGISDPVAFTAVENPYEIQVEGSGDGPEGAIPNGDYWFTNGGKVMAPMAEGATSGVMPANDLINGASTAKNVFTLTYDPDMSYYTIQDSYGRYLGNESWGNDISLTTVLPSGEDYAYYLWSVDTNFDDGTFDVYNSASYNGFAYSAADNNWYLDPVSYETDGIRPTLVLAENPVEEPSGPKAVTVAEFIAAAEDDTVYELSGTISRIVTPYSSQYNNISFNLEDETGEVSIFRMSCEGVADPNSLTVGDEITLQGTRSSYNDAPQMAAGGKYVSHVDKEAPAPEAGTYEMSFSDAKYRTSFSKDQQVWEQNGIKLTNNKAGSTSDVADYVAPVRFYKSTSLKIEKAGMSKIVFYLNSGKPASGLTDSVSDSNAEVSADGYEVTIKFKKAVDVFEIASLANQIRVDSLTVYAE